MPVAVGQAAAGTAVAVMGVLVAAVRVGAGVVGIEEALNRRAAWKVPQAASDSAICTRFRPERLAA